MTPPHSPHLRIGIVGASTLKGKELQTVLRERQFPVSKMVLMDGDEDLGRLSEFDGEPVVSLAITESSFEFLDLVFFAGKPSTALSYARLAAKNSFVSIDLSNAFSKDRQFPLFLEAGKGREPSVRPVQGVICSPHPAVISIALVLKHLSSKHQIRRCVISIFEPASERGKTGIEELEQQTLNIFSFHKGPEVVFRRQLAFNLLSRLGEEAKETLIDVEEIISAQLSTLLEGTCPLPALTLIQAPIFHSHSFSIFVELDQKVPVAEVESLLNSENLTVIRTADEPPSPAQVAGTDTIQIGGIKQDFANPSGLWFWAVSDNLRLAAINAVAAAETIFLP
jgi:aspartate-semialdehyde dehydrogenase